MIKCIAIDDEPIALSIITKYCKQRGGIELETYSSPRVGMERIRELKPDIVFLDIELNSISGIELARQCPDNVCVIFTTAYANYALQGFEVDAVDFLHKPYFYDRFDRAMRKAEDWLKAKRLEEYPEIDERQLILKVEYKNVIISYDQILYVEAMENYVKVIRNDLSMVASQISLKSIENILPKNEFLRIHRSYLVRKSAIASFTKSSVLLANMKRSIPIGRKYSADVFAILAK